MTTVPQAPKARASSPPSAATHPAREWMPRIWEGCDLFAWLRLLMRNRLAVHPRYLYIAIIVTLVSLGHTLLRYLKAAWYGSKVDRTPIRQAPLFIIGHWRTGTTLLHELRRREGRYGLATLCLGGGGSVAMAFERV